jgi:ABC-type dipeptide/oligopeptide/nickel transport system permease subunit
MNRLLRINYSLYAGIILVTSLLLIAGIGRDFAPYSITETLRTYYADGKIYTSPFPPFVSSEYPFGTDQWGYDLLTMILYGIRYTIFIAIAVTFIKMTLGTIIGLYIGTWRKTPGWIESFENSWSYVPLFLILYFFFVKINFADTVKTSSLLFYFILLTALISMPSIVSSVRKKAIEIKKSNFIEAASVLGANRHRIIWKHIFPQLKESLLVMFLLEIVQVITIMGQLSLMNIFIGGTIVQHDPLIFLSKTKELSGLIGQARGSIFGDSLYILLIPLVGLLLTTISFSLLANGLKNYFASNYQRTPWIKTGFEPKLMPKRRVYKVKRVKIRQIYSLRIGIILVSIVCFVALFGREFAQHLITDTLKIEYTNGKLFAPPLHPFDKSEYPLGTNRWGYDLLTLILYGIRYTVLIALSVTVIKMTLGTIIGLYVGTLKRTPSWIESFENSWSYVPLFLVLYFFFVRINFHQSVKTSNLIFYFIILTALISMPSIVSSVRKKTGEINKLDFIDASHVLGANRHRIVWKHIFPQLKESLLVMFTLEIVHVITIMGQLSLMNIFIGGTIVQYDPIIYISKTKELAGLVGQARGNIYGNTFILTIPLLCLLFTTLSFSVLANGLKNYFQTNYQRAPWIKTGFEPKIPGQTLIRKQLK